MKKKIILVILLLTSLYSCKEKVEKSTGEIDLSEYKEEDYHKVQGIVVKRTFILIT